MAMPTSSSEACVRAMLVLCACLMVSGPAFAATYWVSPTGAAAWAGCQSATPLSDTAACSLRTANANAAAGDTVYLRGGTYSLSTAYAVGIAPAHSGTSSKRITFASAPGETAVIEGTGCNECGWGLYIHQGTGTGTYIRITNITFHNLARWVQLDNYASYNEIDHCTLYSDTGEDVTIAVKISGGCVGGAQRNCYSTHNWVHDNYMSKAHRSSGDPTTCYEGRDMIDIGDSYSSSWGSSPCNAANGDDCYLNNNNTIEHNYLEYGGHTLFDGFSQYNVVRNNIMHNEPWTASDGSTCSFPNNQYSNTNYNGKYGHRVFGISNDIDRPGSFDLIEGNRFGFGSSNPNNNGWDALDLMAPQVIIRYNSIYGAANSGFMFKYGDGVRGHGGTNSRLFNNTLYHNGYGMPWSETNHTGCSTCPQPLLAVRFYQSDTINNIVKNNLIYDSRRYALSSQDIGMGASSFTLPAGNVIANNWLTSSGDPRFVNPDMTDPTSQNLFSSAHGYAATPIPDLRLQASSPAIDGGTYLTQAVGAGAGSTTLIVGDSLYFQDGTWGSDLAKGVTMFPDWIAIGTVGNVVQISSINYATNTITLASPMTWANGASIWLYKKSDGAVVLVGAAPDLGASEFGTPPSNLAITVK